MHSAPDDCPVLAIRATPATHSPPPGPGHQHPSALPSVDQIHLASAGIIGKMQTRLRSAEPVFLVGKLAAQEEDAFTWPAGSTGSSLVYLQDKVSSRWFLVDSGASAFVFF